MICPQCKEEMPLLSRICPVCGYVADEDENRPSATELADTLEEILLAARSLPAPSFSRSMGQLSVVMLPLLTLFLLLAALISEAGIFWIATILFALGSIAAIILKICGRIGNGRADREFAELKNNFEFTARIARRDFGKSREVNNLLTEITERIREIEQERRSASRRNLMIWMAILLVGAILAGMGVRSVDKAVAVQEETGWQKELEAFRAAGVVDDYDIETRGRRRVLPQLLHGTSRRLRLRRADRRPLFADGRPRGRRTLRRKLRPAVQLGPEQIEKTPNELIPWDYSEAKRRVASSMSSAAIRAIT